MAATFSTSSVMKRLNGRVALRDGDFENTGFIDCFVELVKQFPGKLHFNSKVDERSVSYEAMKNIEKIRTSPSTIAKLTYVSHIFEQGNNYRLALIEHSPETVFEYKRYLDKHYDYYRPALLNGRHVVDVLTAVCCPADVSEAELSRVRNEATARARHMRDFGGEKWEGIWCAYLY